MVIHNQGGEAWTERRQHPAGPPGGPTPNGIKALRAPDPTRPHPRTGPQGAPPVHAQSLGPFMIAAVLAAALLHAAWNSIAHGIGDRLIGFAMIGVVDIVGGGALVAYAGL